jgi:phosphate acetyltransferase
MPILGALPRDDSLDKPSLREIAQSLHARVLSGTPRLDVLARLVHVAAMGLDQVLARLERGVLVLVPGDRSDLLLGLGAAYGSAVSPSPSGIVLTGGIEPAEATLRLFMDLTRGEMPVLAVPWCSYETALKVSKVQARLDPSQRARIELVKELVEQHVDVGPILARAAAGRDDTRVTPKQFMHRIVDLARKQRMHIVLPEGVERSSPCWGMSTRSSAGSRPWGSTWRACSWWNRPARPGGTSSPRSTCGFVHTRTPIRIWPSS